MKNISNINRYYADREGLQIKGATKRVIEQYKWWGSLFIIYLRVKVKGQSQALQLTLDALRTQVSGFKSGIISKNPPLLELHF